MRPGHYSLEVLIINASPMPTWEGDEYRMFVLLMTLVGITMRSAAR